MIARPGLAYGPDGVYVSGDEEKYGYGAAATDGEPEEWQLEDVRCGLGVVGW